jgi:hypothetical protein
MDQEIFDACFNKWSKSYGFSPFWGELAKKYNYDSGELLRSTFKRERKKRGISKNDLVKENKAPQLSKTNARILLLDCETAPILAFCWSLWQQDINTDAIVSDWFILSWSAKWLFFEKVMSDVLTSDEAKNQDDKRVCKSMLDLLNSCDIVITHNGSYFDLPRLQTRFLKHGFLPPKAYQSIDTLKVAKQSFSFSSNKLDYINQYLGLPKKKHVEFDLWRRCYYGDNDALQEISRYNVVDCEILEDLYLQLRGYIRGHPNLNLWSEENISVCPNCASKDLNWSGHYYTYTGRYASFSCNECGAIGRSRTMDLDKDKRKVIVR